MASQYEIELFSSLKRLFETGDFSDLKITCGDAEHKVHSAIVCPRSELLSKLYTEIEEDSDAVISIVDEDPQAVKLMLHYLYTLDYPQVPARNQDEVVVNGFHADEVKQSPQSVSLEYSIEKEQFVDSSQPTGNDATGTVTGAAAAEPNVPGRSKKSRKKKRQSVSVAPTNGIETLETLPQDSSNLVVHAKVYSLGSKYGVGGLKALSAEKFVREVEQHWDSEDFLGAAQEAYTSTDEQDRTMRDVVLNTLNQHPELLQRKQVQDVIRGLQLSFDLLMLRLNESDGAGAGTGPTPIAA